MSTQKIAIFGCGVSWKENVIELYSGIVTGGECAGRWKNRVAWGRALSDDRLNSQF